tara:strand:- start:2701 stop:2985 length:285 start_codon:yes stop_codon:yes gene_type:complete
MGSETPKEDELKNLKNNSQLTELVKPIITLTANTAIIKRYLYNFGPSILNGSGNSDSNPFHEYLKAMKELILKVISERKNPIKNKNIFVLRMVK